VLNDSVAGEFLVEMMPLENVLGDVITSSRGSRGVSTQADHG
jgi:hypothetical protein